MISDVVIRHPIYINANHYIYDTQPTSEHACHSVVPVVCTLRAPPIRLMYRRAPDVYICVPGASGRACSGAELPHCARRLLSHLVLFSVKYMHASLRLRDARDARRGWGGGVVRHASVRRNTFPQRLHVVAPRQPQLGRIPSTLPRWRLVVPTGARARCRRGREGRAHRAMSTSGSPRRSRCSARAGGRSS